VADLQSVVDYAQSKLGDPYVWGATGPNSFDCSGLVYAAYKAAGYKVSRTTAARLGKMGTPVDLAHAPIGSVVYYNEPGATDHVGILVDKVNGGHMIDAPHTGATVQIDSLGGYTSIRDIAGAAGTPGAAPLDSTGGTGQSFGVTNAGFLPSGDDVARIALKVGASLVAGALLVVGLSQTVKGSS
jgi:hypothetical protein